MHIKTQTLLDEIHNIKTSIQLYQNKNGSNFWSETYIEKCCECEDWLVVTGARESNEPLDSSKYEEAYLMLQDPKMFVSFLGQTE